RPWVDGRAAKCKLSAKGASGYGPIDATRSGLATTTKGELHESQMAWSRHSRKRSDDRARRLPILPASVSAHGISAGSTQDGGRQSLSPQCAVLQSIGRNPLERARGLGI